MAAEERVLSGLTMRLTNATVGVYCHTSTLSTSLMSNAKHKQELIEVLSRLAKSDKKIFGRFLADLLSPREFNDMVKRWQSIKELDKGTPQREIAKRLNISISKVTRGSVALKKGIGFKRALKLPK